MLLLVTWVWWRGHSRPDTHGLQSAILCIATPLALPVTFIYDLVLLSPAIAWIGIDLHNSRANRWEWGLLAGCTLALWPVARIADLYEIQLGSVMVSLILVIAVRRYVLAMKNPNRRSGIEMF